MKNFVDNSNKYSVRETFEEVDIVELIGIKKHYSKPQHIPYILEIDTSEEFCDGNMLSYSNHELTQEQLQEITNYFA